MGRWAGVALNFRGNPPLTVISTYQPTKDQSIQGTINVTTQQTRWLQDHHIQNSVTQQYRQDLGVLIQQLLQQSHEIIIGGDFNEHTYVNNVLQDMVNVHQLVDIVFMTQSTVQSTYKRGTHVLDRIFITRGLTQQTQRAFVDIHSPIIPTDHHPIKLQIDSTTEEQSEFQSRLLVSNHRHKVTKYIQEVYKRMIHSRCFQDIEALGTKTVNAENLNKLDKLFTTIRLQSEKKLKSQHHDWWHTELIEWKHNLEACNRALRKLKRQLPRQEETIIRILTEKQRYISMFCHHTQNSLQLRHNMLREEIQKLRTEKLKNTTDLHRNNKRGVPEAKVQNRTQTTQQYIFASPHSKQHPSHNYQYGPDSKTYCRLQYGPLYAG
jgi:hypothetical protein